MICSGKVGLDASHRRSCLALDALKVCHLTLFCSKIVVQTRKCSLNLAFY